MRKYMFVSVLSILVLFSISSYGGSVGCIKCHSEYKDGYVLKNDFRGDIYRILEHPCYALSKVREECYNTEVLLNKTQMMLDDLHGHERIEISQLQKSLDVWNGKYRELLSREVNSLQDFKNANTVIRFNIQKVYSVAADYQIKLQNRIAFGFMVCCSLLLTIFFIQGFKNAGGPGHITSHIKDTSVKVAGCILVLMLLIQPLYSEDVSDTESSTQKMTYLDKLANTIEPLKDVSNQVYQLALAAQMIRAEDKDNAFKLMMEARKLWDKSNKMLSVEIQPMYQNADKTGWVESDENRFSKIGNQISDICAPWALRELVLLELDFGLDGKEKRIDGLLTKIESLSSAYERYGQLSEVAGLLAKRDVEGAKSAVERIDDNFFKARAYANLAKNVDMENGMVYADQALEIARSVIDPRFKTEILISIYNDLDGILKRPDRFGWMGIESGFDIKAEGKVKAMWYSRLVEMLSGFDNKKAMEIADKISTDYPEPKTAAQLFLYENGADINLSGVFEIAKKIDDVQNRDVCLSKIASYIAKSDIEKAHEIISEIELDFYKDPALSEILFYEFKDDFGKVTDELDQVVSPFVRAELKLRFAELLIKQGKMTKASELLISASSDAGKSFSIEPVVKTALMWQNVDFSKSLTEVRGLKEIRPKVSSLVELSNYIKSKNPELAKVLLQEAYEILFGAPKISNGDKALGIIFITSNVSNENQDMRRAYLESSINLLIGE